MLVNHHHVCQSYSSAGAGLRPDSLARVLAPSHFEDSFLVVAQCSRADTMFLLESEVNCLFYCVYPRTPIETKTGGSQVVMCTPLKSLQKIWVRIYYGTIVFTS
jgi:hypothetical protein